MLGLTTEFWIGSCEWDVDTMLNTMEKLGAGNHCSLYDCKLPIPAGKYGTKAFEAKIPKIPPMIVRDLEGKLAARVSVKSDGKEIMCADVSIDLTTK